MKVVCAWCQHESRPALLREVEPLDDLTETHGICDAHHAVVLRQLFPPAVAADQGERGVAAEPVEPLRRLQAWSAEGTSGIVELVARLAAAVEALRPRVAVAEAEQAHLEASIEHLRDILAGVRSEHDALMALRQEAGRLTTQLLERTLDETLQPLHALAERLRPGARRRASVDAARRAVDTGDESA